MQDTNLIQATLDRCEKHGLTVTQFKFASYCTLVYSRPPFDLPQDFREAIEQAFMAGMALYHGDVMSELGEGDDVTEEELEIISKYRDRIMGELEEFSEGALARFMRTEGSA